MLLVSFSYPPLAAGGDRLRAEKLAKYLPMYDWQVTVLTVTNNRTHWGHSDPSIADESDARVIHAPFLDVLGFTNRTLSYLRGKIRREDHGNCETVVTSPTASIEREKIMRWLRFPDRMFLWFPTAVVRGLWELRKPYDALLTTGPPVTNHMVGYVLNLVTGIPWLVDFQDLWSQNPYRYQTAVLDRTERALERAVVSRADMITAVSQWDADSLKALHERADGEVLAITNGFDHEDFTGPVPAPSPDGITLTYAGLLYGLKRDPRPLLKVIEEMIAEGLLGPDEIRVRIYSPIDPLLIGVKHDLENPEILELCGVVTSRESIASQRRSTILLNLIWDDPSSAFAYGGKVFEYMGSRRPILSWAPTGGAPDQLLEATRTGRSAADAAALRNILEEWLDEFRKTGSIEYNPREEEVNRYRWDMLAGQFADCLTTVVRNARDRAIEP